MGLFDWFRGLFDDEPEWDGVFIDFRDKPEPVDIDPVSRDDCPRLFRAKRGSS